MTFDGKEGDRVEGWNEVGDASNADAVLHSICGTPACCRDVLFVVAKSDEWWSGARVLEEVKLGEKVATSCHVMGGATVWDGI